MKWTYWEVSEDLERGAQEVDEVHEVPGGSAVRLRHAPFIVCQLDELVDLLVQFGVDLTLGSMSSILSNRAGLPVKSFQSTLQNGIHLIMEKNHTSNLSASH